MNERERVLELARAAAESLERSRSRIDDLNVYPVPDGDTGTNLALTSRAVVDALAQSQATDRPELVHQVSRAALMGARGNSGVILSQIVRGAAEELGASERMDPETVARALRGASDAAYRGVRKPVEGTMLTVIRELAEEGEERVDKVSSIGELMPLLVARGDDAVARTPEQLVVLREAGVVDAGAAGLAELVRGLAAAISGVAVPEAPEHKELNIDAVHQDPSRYRYCTAFVVEGDALDSEALEVELEQLGDSLLVVGDPSALKVHVHTDDPGAALGIGTRAGNVEAVEIANMHQQTQAREQRLLRAVPDLPNETDVVAVVLGDGNRRLYESLGATGIVEGGQTANPSTADLVEAIEATRAPEVVLLPNNPNVLLTAEQAVGAASKPVHVVPTDSLQAGLAALVAYDGGRSAAENAAEMRLAADRVATGAVTTASRDVNLNGHAVESGAYLGLLEGEPVTGGPSFDEVANTVAERLLSEPREVMTLLTGDEEPALDELLSGLQKRHPDLEVEVHEGGQPHYPLLLSVE
ncbi:MAG: DAK2 domain-containing protein [Actinomycetota bacterium]|nr:DAK2 domain-containing protein [Actinomycetota bacterium]